MQLGAEELQEINNLLASRDQHLKRLYADIKRLNTDLSYLRCEFGVDRSDEGFEPDENDTEETVMLKKRLAGMQRRIHEFEHSSSWRITRPIRALKRAMKGKA
jgi:hypothetical protein